MKEIIAAPTMVKTPLSAAKDHRTTLNITLTKSSVTGSKLTDLIE